MPTVSLSQLQNRVWDRLDSNTLLYTAANLTDAINECLRVVNIATGFAQTTVQIPGLSQENRIFYDIPTGPGNILIPMRCQFESGYLYKYFPNAIGKAFAAWVTDTTASTGMPVSHWIPLGLKKFAIHPADSIGGSPIFITGVQELVPLVNLTDTVPIPNEYSDLIVNLSAQVLTLKETGALFKQSAAYYQVYLSQIKKLLLWRSAIMPRFFIPEMVQKP